MIRILFENADLLAVDKPEGLISSPWGKEGTLGPLLAEAGLSGLFVVHRLDKDTSGVLLLARNAESHKFLNGQFSARNVRKTYLAFVHGKLREKKGSIDKPIREFGSGRMGVDPSRGKPSLTEYEVEECFPGFTLLRVHPATGRRHQIRVHLYSLGHPVAGDLLYGDKEGQKTFPRLMLHALEITFRTPSGEDLTVAAPPPGSFLSVLDGFRKAAGG